MHLIHLILRITIWSWDLCNFMELFMLRRTAGPVLQTQMSVSDWATDRPKVELLLSLDLLGKVHVHRVGFQWWFIHEFAPLFKYIPSCHQPFLYHLFGKWLMLTVGGVLCREKEHFLSCLLKLVCGLVC